MKTNEMDSKLTSVLIKSENGKFSDKSDFRKTTAKCENTFLNDEGYFDVDDGCCFDEECRPHKEKYLTYLVLSMPGSGKSTWCRQKNFGKSEDMRPAIDFDYKGTRFYGRDQEMVSLKQTELFNRFNVSGVKYITTFVGSFNPWTLSRYFKTIFVLPATYDDLMNLVERVKIRDSNGDGVFPKMYEEKAVEWLNEWKRIYNFMKRDLKMDVELRLMKSDQYLSDILNDI
jgi:hypothetical protein